MKKLLIVDDSATLRQQVGAKSWIVKPFKAELTISAVGKLTGG